MQALRTYGFFAVAGLALLASVVVTTGELEAYALIPQLAAAVAVVAGLVVVNLRLGTVATAALEVGLSWYLFQQKVDTASGKALCDINEVLSCGAINNSAYSEMGGIPITLLGIGFYGGLMLAVALASTDDEQIDRVVFGGGLFSVLYSVFLGWAASQIGAVCVICITMYFGNMVLLWAGWKGLSERGLEPFDGLGAAFGSRHTTFVLAGVVLSFLYGQQVYKPSVAMPSVATVTDGQTPERDLSAELAQLYVAPKGPIALSGAEPVLGNPDAPYTVVEFADYGCPHCAVAAKELKDLVAAYPEVQVKFKYYPRSGPCNPDLPEAATELCQAAYAAECAHEQGRFWDMSSQLFTNQGYFAPEQLSFMAKDLGLDMATWETCMQGDTAPAAVRASAASGNGAGILGTPTLFVQGLTGDGYVEVTRGVAAVAALVEAHKGGVDLPPPNG